MDDIREIQNQRWHALQRNLAQGIHAEVVADYAASLEGVKERRTALCANSWLGRSRRPTEPLPTP